MRPVQVFGIILMLAGAIMTFFVRGILKDSVEKIIPDEDGKFNEVFSNSAIIFKIIGLIIVVAGAIMFFY